MYGNLGWSIRILWPDDPGLPSTVYMHVQVSLPFPRSLARSSFYHTLRMALLPDSPFLTPLPSPPDAPAPASPTVIARTDAEENSLITFVLQHLKAVAFAHIEAAVVPGNQIPKSPKPTSIAAFRAAVTAVVQRRREGGGSRQTAAVSLPPL